MTAPTVAPSTVSPAVPADVSPPGPPAGATPASLTDARAAIPAACYARSWWRGAAAVAQAGALYAVPLAALVVTDRWWAVALLWLATGLGVSGLFVIGHDASHGALFRSPRMNRMVARLCFLPSAHAEAGWDLGHNRIHHGYTARQGFDFVWHPVTVEEYRASSRLARLQHRLEWSVAGAGPYFLRNVWWQKMWRWKAEGKRRHEIVRDKVLVAAVWAVAIAGTVTAGALTGGWVDAVWLPVKLLVVPFLIFTHVIGWAVYVHHIAPDIRWWTRREWSQFKGQMEATTVLHAPVVVNKLWLHNIFVHVPHHVDTRLPFHQLPRAARALSEAFPGTVREAKMSLRAYLRTTRQCKLYDFGTGTWSTYREARSTSLR